MDDDAVAIVGLTCRLPGAPDAERFWANLTRGRDSISRFTAAELAAAGVSAEFTRRPGYVAAQGVLDRADHFDWSFFGYSQAEAARIDPQQRVFLECAAAALADAALDPARFPGLIGVFAGCDAAPLAPEARDDVSALLGAEKDFLATRVAYKLGLRGPAITVQTACSTSLVAVHQACQSLLGYECDAALAGGASIQFPQVRGYLYQEGGILARDGCCRPFDASASGTVSSNGVGVVVLRRLRDALRDGHHVVAVIRGSAINNDGGQRIGFTAPAVRGQRDVIRMALGRADVDPADIWYVEAHATATQVGDPVEVAALTAAFRQSTDAIGSCWIGGVKGNIGHTGAAAGVSGLIKTALMLERRRLLPTAHFEHPNAGLEIESSPFKICDTAAAGPDAGPLLAGVSSFGMGGTNAHAVLESPPAVSRSRARGEVPRVFCLSAATPDALQRSRQELASRLSSANDPPEDVAWTLAVGRGRYPFRATLVAADRAELAAALTKDSEASVRAAEPARVAFLFPGQGALRGGNGVAAAHRELPEFGQAFDQVADLLRTDHGTDLAAVIDPGTDPVWFLDTENQQLALFAIGFAFARQLDAWGVTPAAMLGNSIGEYVAATVAGVWDLPDALAIVTERGRAMRGAREGRMLAIDTDGPAAAALIDENGDLDLALAVDSPGRIVVSGSLAAIETLQGRLDTVPTRLLSTRRAFHSPAMAPAATRLRDMLTGMAPAEPALAFVSNLSGEWIDAKQAMSPGYWAEHLCGTVRLADGMTTLLSSDCQVFAELGPGRTMSGSLRRHPGWTPDRTAVALLGGGDSRGVLSAVGELWRAGVDVSWDSLFRSAEPRRCVLPPYPLDPLPCGQGPSRRVDTGRRESVILVTAGHRDGSRLAEELADQGITVSAVVDLDVRADPVPVSGDISAAVGRPSGSASDSRTIARATESLGRYSAGLVATFVLDQAGLAPGERIAEDELRRRVDPASQLPRMVSVFLDALTAHRFLTRDGTGFIVADAIADEVAAALTESENLSGLHGLRQLLEHCASGYPDVFSGTVEPAAVLFPGGSDTLLETSLHENDIDLSNAGQCLDTLCEAIREICVASHDGRPVRILEVGAGGGELTRRLLAGWERDARAVYLFTDISPLRVRMAEERITAPPGVDLRFSVYDMTADPLEQGFTPGTFDLVLGYNSVHVARDVRQVLGSLCGLLTGTGWLCLAEVTRVALWDQMIWGLAPGWWDFDDSDGLRDDSPVLDASRWRRVLAASGFTDIAVLPTVPDADHAAIIAAPARTAASGPADRVKAEFARQIPRTRAWQFQRQEPARREPRNTAPHAVPGDPGRPDADAFVRALAGQWTSELGVAAVKDGDNFFALGGDSLMVVHLLSRINEELGAAVPIAAFTEEPTFGGLVRLASPDQADDVAEPGGPPGLLTFRKDGSCAPLFLAAPAIGTSLCYRELATRLSTDQPVYGIESPGLSPGARLPRRIEEIAEHHVEVVRRTRPHGPYVLGGWSVGAIVAHEMARQFAGRGEDTELVLCLDGYVPHTHGRSLGMSPGHLVTGLLYQVQVATRVGEVGALARSVPNATGLFNANVRAMLRYRPAPVGCRAVLFKTQLNERLSVRLRRQIAPEYERGVEVRPCAGIHWTMLSPPHVGLLADAINAELSPRTGP